jgi:hypothetical protein
MTGWLWILLTVIGAAVLGLGIAYGMSISQQRRRDPGAQQRTEKATHDLYEAEARREAR